MFPPFDVTNCSRTKIATGSSGQVVLGAAVPGKRCVLVALVVVVTTANALTLEETGGTDLSGPMAFGANGGFVLPPNAAGWLASSSGQGLALNVGSAVQTNGWALYRYVDG